MSRHFAKAAQRLLYPERTSSRRVHYPLDRGRLRFLTLIQCHDEADLIGSRVAPMDADLRGRELLWLFGEGTDQPSARSSNRR
jgi:hypothetical protein